MQVTSLMGSIVKCTTSSRFRDVLYTFEHMKRIRLESEKDAERDMREGM
jgi:hypothetical protein